MIRPCAILIQKPDAFVVVVCNGRVTSAIDVSIRDPSDSDASAEALAQALHSHGYRGWAALLAIGSSSCLAASFPFLARRDSAHRDRKGWLFAMEEYIPLSAEDMVADFVTEGSEAVGVAVATAEVLPLVEALERRGVTVQSIVPAALLALQHTIDKTALNSELVLWHTGAGVEMFCMKNHRPRLWRSVPADAIAVRWELGLSRNLLGSATTVVARNLPAPFVDQIEGAVQSEDGLPFDQAVQLSASQVLAGRLRPWVELRRDAMAAKDPLRLIRGTLRFAMACTMAMLVLLVIAAWLQARRYAEAAERCYDRQRSVFREVFPGRTVPVGIRRNLESELRKLSGTRSTVGDIPELESVTELLQRVLAAVPEDIRCRLLELRIDKGTIQIDGECRSHGDAETLAAALRAVGFSVEQPRTENLPTRGVSMSLVATTTQQPDVAKVQP